MPKKARDLSGQKFGRLSVLRRADNKDNNRIVWSCQCDCGMELDARSSSLVCGHTTSCGCYARESVASRSKTHGMSRSREMESWQAMKRRCLRPTYHGYANYGGRGITICDEWIDSFSSFYKDMGPRAKGATLDRIDNSKGYCKENCRWASENQQQNNKRSNRYLLLHGVVMSLSEWSGLAGVPHGTITNRLSKGYSEACSIFAPVYHRLFRPGTLSEEQRVEYEKEFLTVAYLALVGSGKIDTADTEPRPMNDQEMLDLHKYLMSVVRRSEVKQ